MSEHSRTVVDEHFPRRDKYHVWEQNGLCLWDAVLNQINIKHNNNKIYKLQILESNSNPKHYIVWFRWARVGNIGQTSTTECGSDTQKAINLFCNKFKDKTNNDWNNRNNFKEHNNKYTYLPMNYSFTHLNSMFCDFSSIYVCTYVCDSDNKDKIKNNCFILSLQINNHMKQKRKAKRKK